MEINETNKYFLPVAVIVAGLFIAGAVMWNGSKPAGSPGSPLSGTAPSVNIKDINTDGNPFIGDVNAPVVIASWGDFKCQYCKNFETQTLPQIISDYVETGKVKIVFMDFAFLGERSTTLALYGRSVWNLYPEQYFAWRTAVFNAQDGEGNQGFGDVASIDKLNATIAGIDATKIAADVKTNKKIYEEQMNDDKKEGQKVGIGATPSFVIGTEVIQGAYPYPTFQAAIDAALSK
ncbi:MAG: thioredoxin domain-containing protein [bacterium]|nr:thioredoxin domain-containing protein [bacterium]